jgi:citrate lyase subunit beta / citryl-CoA lyase
MHDRYASLRDDPMMPITYLFVPGAEEHKGRNAWGSGADAVILDLEDAIPPAEKNAARTKVVSLIEALASGGSRGPRRDPGSRPDGRRGGGPR